MVLQAPFPLCPDLPLNHPSVPVIYQPGAVSEHRKIVGNTTFEEAVARVAADADALVTWGIPELDEALPQSFRGRVIVSSKSSGAYDRSFLSRNALLTSHYVANSIKSVEAYPPSIRDHVQVIYTGVDARRLAVTRSRDEVRQEWQLGPDDRVVGFLGRIAEDKGVERIVDAVRELDPRWKAVFVGRNGNFSDYERRFEQLCDERLPGRHHLAGWRSDVGNVLRAMDVMAYPSDDEGFANSLAEAWLAGVPTVATQGVGAMAEEPWRQCSIRVGPRCSPEELRTAIEAAFGNETLVKRARRIADTLTVDRTVAAWQDYLTRAVRNSRRTRVMVLLPNLMIGGIHSWLVTLMRHAPEIAWVCLCVVSETAGFEGDPRLAEDLLKLGCPIVGIPRLPEPEVQRRLERVLRQTRPDVVLQAGVRHLDRTYPDTSIPLVTVSHGPSESAWAVDVLSESCRRATKCVAVSASAAKAYSPVYRGCVTVIPNGVEMPPPREVRARMRVEAREQLRIGTRQIAVGFLGRLSPEKNPTLVARSVAELSDRYCAVFVGPSQPEVLAEIERITKRFRHVPAVRPAEAGRWLTAFDVLVCPSEFESFGLSMVEAWTFGVPVVATPVGVIRELRDSAADVAVTVSVGASPAEWAAGIRRALQERAQRLPLCRRLARERFNAVRMGAQWQRMLQDLAEGGSADRAELQLVNCTTQTVGN
jgi:glycosyltransferase involved in cell wall biosynthesis